MFGFLNFRKFGRKRGGFVTAPVVQRRKFFHTPKISRTKLTIALLVVFFLLIGYAIFFSSLFKLRLVEFKTEYLNCVEKSKIIEMMPKNQNLLYINVTTLGDVIKSRYPCLQFVQLQKKFPETIVVEVSERKMAAVLKFGIKPHEVKIELPEESSPSSTSARQVVPPVDDFKINEGDFPKTFGVDNDGFLLTDNPQSKDPLPLFYYLAEHEYTVNNQLPPHHIERAIQLSNKLWELGLSVTSQKIMHNSLYIDGPQRIIFLLEKDPSEQVIPLQLILQKAKIDSTPIEKIDLRFDKPVVVYGKKTTR